MILQIIAEHLICVRFTAAYSITPKRCDICLVGVTEEWRCYHSTTHDKCKERNELGAVMEDNRVGIGLMNIRKRRQGRTLTMTYFSCSGN